MKEVRIQEAIQKDPELLAAVKQATQVLEGQTTESAAEADAEWTLQHDGNGHRVLELKLSDYAGSVQDRFAPDELKQRDWLPGRMSRLWDDLLRVRIQLHLNRLRKLSAEQEASRARTDDATTQRST
jgi:hypothetical protein